MHPMAARPDGEAADAVSEVEVLGSWGCRLLVCSSNWEWVSVDTGISKYNHGKISSEPLF